MELKQMIKGPRELVLMKVDREQNKVADLLATHARMGHVSTVFGLTVSLVLFQTL